MGKYKVGIVIPVYLTKFIEATIDRLSTNLQKTDVVYCIVNDGVEEVREYLEVIDLAENMYVLNLPKNKCYAGSNNAGWKSLMEKYPDLEFLGSLNDDTICFNSWLDDMIDTIYKDKEIAAVAPNVLGVGEDNTFYYYHATFDYGKGLASDMVVTKAKIDEDEYVKLIGGCCFVTRRKALEAVDFLDETFRNFCEDVDLSLKFITSGYKMAICSKAYIAHCFGPSRTTRKNHDDDIIEARRYLRSKWGNDLSKYN